MTAFRFRLETLLKLREAERQQRRAALSEAFHAERLLNEEIYWVTQELDHTRRSARLAAGGTIDVGRLLDMDRYELILQTQTSALNERKQQVADEIAKRRESLVEADRQVRVLEKLREKRLAEHTHEELNRETKELDEVGRDQRRRRNVL
jgi:flagellar FliJ protein